MIKWLVRKLQGVQCFVYGFHILVQVGLRKLNTEYIGPSASILSELEESFYLYLDVQYARK